MPRALGTLPLTLTLLGLALGGCAGRPHDDFAALGGQRVLMSEEDPAADTPPPPPPKRRKVSVMDYANSHRNAPACETAARRMREVKPKKGWALMRACAARKDFTQIDLALKAPWIDDVRSYPRSGARMVSRVVANRGGNLKLDLGLVNDRGVQLFDLSTAMASGRVFRGRMVLMRGKLLKMQPVGPRTQLELAETTLEADNIQETWRHYRKRRSQERAVRSRRRSRRTRGARREYGRTKYRPDGDDGPKITSLTRSTETKRYVVTTVDEVPKGLKIGEEFLFLVRFEALAEKTRANPDAEKKYARASFVGHFEPLEDIP